MAITLYLSCSCLVSLPNKIMLFMSCFVLSCFVLLDLFPRPSFPSSFHLFIPSFLLHSSLFFHLCLICFKNWSYYVLSKQTCARATLRNRWVKVFLTLLYYLVNPLEVTAAFILLISTVFINIWKWIYAWDRSFLWRRWFIWGFLAQFRAQIPSLTWFMIQPGVSKPQLSGPKGLAFVQPVR